MIIFQYKYNLLSLIDLKKIKKISKLKKLNILDFGCGKGVWEKKFLKKKFINKIILYDKNKSLLGFLKKKYSLKKIVKNFNKKNLLNKNINLIIFSSVIQYMSKKELNSFLSTVNKKYKTKPIYILINDFPNFNRFIELILIPFINFKKFIYYFSLVFNKQYLSINYYRHNLYKNIFLNKIFIIRNIGYIGDMKFLRSKILLIKK